MTRLALAAGVGLATSQRRLAPGYMQPVILADGTSSATSLRAQATATASGTPHTKGAWVEIITATTSEASYLMLSLAAVTNTGAADTSTLLDVGIGAAASEVVIVPNISVGYQININCPLYEFPVHIPAGSRVAIRCQSVVGSKTVAAQIVLGQLPNSRRAPDTIVDIGSNLATSRGVSLATPAGANAKGAWTEIVAATAEPYDSLAIGVQAAADTTLAATAGVLLDIGYGASGSEIVLGPDLPLISSSAEAYTWEVTPLIPCRLPRGTRLAARFASSSTTNNGLDVILYGVRA